MASVAHPAHDGLGRRLPGGARGAARRGPPFQLREPEIALRDPDGRSRQRSVELLGAADAEGLAARVAALLADRDACVRRAAADVLARMGGRAAPEAAALLRGGGDEARAGAAGALGRMGAPAVPCAARLLGDAEAPVRATAGRALAECLRGAGAAQQQAAVEAVASAGGERAVEHLLPLLGDPDRRVRQRAARALAGVGGAAAPPAARLLCAGEREASEAAAQVLCLLGDEATPELLALLGAGDESARAAAARVLRQIGAGGGRAALEALDLWPQAAGEDAPEAPSARAPPRSARAGAGRTADLGASESGGVGEASEGCGSCGGGSLLPEAATGSPGRRCAPRAPALDVATVPRDLGGEDCAAERPGAGVGAPQPSVELESPGQAEKDRLPLLTDRFGHSPTDAAASAASELQCGAAGFRDWALAAIASLMTDRDPAVRQAAAEALHGRSPRSSSSAAPGASPPRQPDGAERAVPSSREARTGTPQHDHWGASDTDLDLVGLLCCGDPGPEGPGWRASPTDVTPGQPRQSQGAALPSLGPRSQPEARRCHAEATGGLSRAALASGRYRDAAGHARQAVVLLHDHRAGVRHAAVRALPQATAGDHEAAHAEAVVVLLKDPDSFVRAAAAAALGEMGEAGAGHAPGVAALLGDGSAEVRRAASLALGALRSDRGAAQAALYLRSPLPEVRASAADAFREMGPLGEAHAAELCDLLADTAAGVRSAAADALVGVGRPAGAHAAALLAHPEPHVRLLAVRVLGALGGAGSAEARLLLAHRLAAVRCAALAALGAMGEAAAEHAAAVACALHRPLGPGGQQGRWPERLEACRALGRMGRAALPHAAQAALLLRDREAAVRAAAVEALARMLSLAGGEAGG